MRASSEPGLRPLSPTIHSPSLGALPELRAATHSRHEHIERLLGFDAPMPLARYADILRGFHRFLSAWEPEVRQALPARLQAWLDERGRHDALAADLACLEAEAAEHPLPALPACLPEASVPAAFGSLYVIEGSALGGQVIAARLKRELGLEPGRGASYFHGHGERTGAMWREFRQLAEAEIGADPIRRRQACRAAQQTFDVLIEAFQAPAVLSAAPGRPRQARLSLAEGAADRRGRS
jgi:heme oxygenase